MGHALSRSIVAEPQLERKQFSVLLGGLVLCGNDHFPVRIRTLSPGGAWVDAAVVPAVGSIVRLSRGLNLLTARVVHIERGGFELMFCDALDEPALRALLGTPAAQADDNRLPVSKH